MAYLLSYRTKISSGSRGLTLVVSVIRPSEWSTTSRPSVTLLLVAQARSLPHASEKVTET